jgi:hypothetical protein
MVQECSWSEAAEPPLPIVHLLLGEGQLDRLAILVAYDGAVTRSNKAPKWPEYQAWHHTFPDKLLAVPVECREVLLGFVVRRCPETFVVLDLPPLGAGLLPGLVLWHGVEGHLLVPLGGLQNVMCWSQDRKCWLQKRKLQCWGCWAGRYSRPFRYGCTSGQNLDQLVEQCDHTCGVGGHASSPPGPQPNNGWWEAVHSVPTPP